MFHCVVHALIFCSGCAYDGQAFQVLHPNVLHFSAVVILGQLFYVEAVAEHAVLAHCRSHPAEHVLVTCSRLVGSAETIRISLPVVLRGKVSLEPKVWAGVLSPFHRNVAYLAVDMIGDRPACHAYACWCLKSSAHRCCR